MTTRSSIIIDGGASSGSHRQEGRSAPYRTAAGGAGGRARRLWRCAIAGSRIAVLVVAAAAAARATTIEGYTPGGEFQSVLVTQDGRLEVALSTGIPQHVISDAGSQVFVSSVGGTVAITGNVTATGSFSATASTAATPSSGQVSMTAVQAQIYAASSTRKQSIICNRDPAMTAFIGATGVTTVSGFALLPGACMSPDVPASFQGALFGISTATAMTDGITFFTVSP